jgi:hypothetical protein
MIFFFVMVQLVGLSLRTYKIFPILNNNHIFILFYIHTILYGCVKQYKYIYFYTYIYTKCK